jgi:hypothetical protein
VIAWAKDENELRMKKRKMKTGMEWTRERGAMRKSIVLSGEQGRVCTVHYLWISGCDPPAQF